jgi:hypothetical protein
MKMNFFSPVHQVCSALLACSALTVHVAAAIADDKSPVQSSGKQDQAKSLVERVAQASKVPWPGWAVLKPLGDWAQSDQEAKDLADIYAVANDAWANVQPGPDAGAQREAIKFELTHELESVPSQKPKSLTDSFRFPKEYRG